MTRLNGTTAVITGGSTGIGRAAAKRFIDEGAFVYIFGRRQDALDAAVTELGPNARAVKGSVSDEADLDRLYATVKAERGTLDVVFANAGAGSQLALGKITASHIDETFDTNVKGTIFTVQKTLPPASSPSPSSGRLALSSAPVLLLRGPVDAWGPAVSQGFDFFLFFIFLDFVANFKKS